MNTSAPSVLFRVSLVLMMWCPLRGIAAPPPYPELVQQVTQLLEQVNVLQAQVSALQTQNSTLQADITTLQSQVEFLQAPPENFIAVAPYISLETVNNKPTVRFTGVNLQIVNGIGQTFSSNGLGNIIVGYDEPRTGGPYSCSLGMFVDETPLEDQTSCESHNFTWALNHKTGSHYLVLGQGANYSRSGGIVGGTNNTSNNDFSSVITGSGNTASGTWAFVASGQNNKASGNAANVSGGIANMAGGGQASVSGGGFNQATGSFSVVSGGGSNSAEGSYSSIGGGSTNTASGGASSVSGGVNNAASGDMSSVLGGVGQEAAIQFQTIPATP